MDQKIRDLLQISLKAQYSYIRSRLKESDKFNFDIDVRYILQEVWGNPKFNEVVIDTFNFYTKTKLERDVFELYLDTYQLLMNRFVNGRSTEYIWEKL